MSWYTTQSELGHLHSSFSVTGMCPADMASFQCSRLHQLARPQPKRRVVASALDPDNASIMVCGGAGVALSTTRKAKDMGAWVWMMQRSDKLTSEIEKMMAFKVKGDAMDKASVAKAMSSAVPHVSSVTGATHSSFATMRYKYIRCDCCKSKAASN